MAKKHYPVVLSTSLEAVTPVTGTTRIIQADRVASELNRRLMRMGRYYELKIDLDPTSTEVIEVYALRDDWAVQKAFQLAYEMYRKNTADERDMLSAQQIARWEDFRVEVGWSGNTDTLLPVLYDILGSAQRLETGEFALSNVVDTGGTVRTFTWGNPSGSQWGILQQYDNVANAQSNPSSVMATGPYESMQENIDFATMDNLQADGNQPPYDQTGVNSDKPFVKIAQLGSATSGAQKLSTGFFTAPCGIVILTGVTVAGDDDLQLTYKKGDYKGVHAPSMLE